MACNGDTRVGPSDASSVSHVGDDRRVKSQSAFAMDTLPIAVSLRGCDFFETQTSRGATRPHKITASERATHRVGTLQTAVRLTEGLT